ncbi:MAG: tRNA (cytosine(32)/uridine(32)-2'-O)-methyltransferase TrmJ [Gammaproteobacteria bacterium]|nr:MAG: tRNA (cytosine(32)/uridine(32)-2'-O)-methyltransferase TrmJ [Gammaproteobacteria bacterium]
MLNHIRIVLVNTSHPGNIGSAARAMKTMGLTELYLVSPEQFPHDKANEMASGATDILDQAVIVETLDEAIADCGLVVGASARTRTIPWPLFTPREIAEKIKAEPPHPVAILFGREQSGLTNEELQRCHWHVQIPANPAYSSLNVAAAVQVMAYELRVASLDQTTFSEEWDYRLATADEMEKFFVHLQEVLVELDFLKLNAPRKLMTRLRRLFFRARPDVMEMNILRGILGAIQNNKI